MPQLKSGPIVIRYTIIFGVFLASWLVAHGAETISAQTHGGRIEGIVVSDDGDRPLAHQKVWLNPQPGIMGWAPPRTTQTDETGRFVFDRVNPGRYRLSIGPEGYQPRVYPDWREGDRRNYLEVREGAVVSDIRINVHPAGKISGTVVNQQGEPQSGFIVKLFHVRAVGEPKLQGEAETEESGHYHLDRIYPNRYVLRAERTKGSENDTRIDVSYYGDAVSFDSAKLLDVSPGTVLTGVDVVVSQTAASALVSGTVTDAETGKPLTGVEVVAAEVWELTPSHLRKATTAADGSYRLAGMLPGNYLIATDGTKVGNGYQYGFRTRLIDGTASSPGEISLSGSHVIDFALIPAPMIVATVEYVGSRQQPVGNDYAVSLECNSPTSMNNNTSHPYRASRTFEFRGLDVAPVRIGVGFASVRFKLDKVLLGDDDVTGKWINLHPGEKLANVRILITDR